MGQSQTPDKRIQECVDFLASVAALDFSNRLTYQTDGDNIDALACGLNMLAEELAYSVVSREEKEESETRFRNVLDAIDDMVFVKGPDSKLMWGNQALLTYSGMTADKFGRIIYVPDVDPDITAQYLEDDNFVFTTGKRLEIPEEPIVRFDGEVRTFHTVKSPIFDSKGKVVLLVGRSTDITERKRMLMALQKSEQERGELLERERQARAAAEMANKAKDQFLATLSHELRTPLTVILSWAQLLMRGTLDQEKTKYGLEILERSAKAQSQLIDDLLDISRIQAGKLNLQIQEVDPQAAITAAIDSTRSLADSKSMQIEVALNPSVKSISADPGRLQQILWNLINNAIKFSPPGGKIWISLDSIHTKSGKQICIRVRDKGKGIAPEFIPSLFESFTQVENSSTRSHGGLGLGLSIVRKLVEMHRGSVEVESPGEGQGATFSVNLPVNSTTEIPKEKSDTAVSLAGLRILLVDDEDSAREVLSEMIRSFGATVKTAASASEALSLLAEFEPNVLVSDIAMPVEDGYSLIKKMRALNSKLGQTPALALTAYAGQSNIEQAQEAGFQSHLAKPVDANKFAQAIAKLAGRAD